MKQSPFPPGRNTGGKPPDWKSGLQQHEIRLRGFPRAALGRDAATSHACRAPRDLCRRHRDRPRDAAMPGGRGYSEPPGWKPGLQQRKIRLRGFPRAALERVAATSHACYAPREACRRHREQPRDAAMPGGAVREGGLRVVVARMPGFPIRSSNPVLQSGPSIRSSNPVLQPLPPPRSLPCMRGVRSRPDGLRVERDLR
jgi:hypothetical protein